MAVRKEVKKVFGFHEIRKDSIYLGNSLALSRNKTKEFKTLKDRSNNQLSGWNRYLLSKAGKATMIKSIIQAIPIYTMSTFRVSDGVCDDMDVMVRNFLWESKGKKIL